MTDWADLFGRLRRAQDILDPRAFRGSLRDTDTATEGGKALPPALAGFHAVAADHERLDRRWSRMAVSHAVRLKQRLDASADASPWNATWFPFARDGAGGTLLVDEATGRIIVHRTDPAVSEVIFPDLRAWLVDCVERLEAEVRALPPHHARDLELFAAVHAGDLEGARRALDSGADPNAHDDVLQTALSRAAAEPRLLGLARLLLERGADASLPGAGPPLFRAIDAGNIDAVMLLLEHGVDPDRRETYYGATPLIAAAERGDLRLTELLVQRGADVNARVLPGSGPNSALGVGETALCKAAERDALEVLVFLLEHGSDPDLANATSRGPLAVAIRRRNAEAVRRLLAAGADPNLADHHGKRPLALAMEAGRGIYAVPVDPEIVALLRAHGATNDD